MILARRNELHPLKEPALTEDILRSREQLQQLIAMQPGIFALSEDAIST